LSFQLPDPLLATLDFSRLKSQTLLQFAKLARQSPALSI
jgi:hypothetical protein